MTMPTIRDEDAPTDWMQKGDCHGTQLNPTRPMCRACSVRFECLDFGLGETADMMFGGYSLEARAKLLKRAGHDRGRAMQIARESERRKR